MQIFQVPNVLRSRFYFTIEMLFHDPQTCRVPSFSAWKQPVCNGDFVFYFRLRGFGADFDSISFDWKRTIGSVVNS